MCVCVCVCVCADLDGLAEEALPQHLSVDEVTGAEDPMGAATGGAEGLGAPDVPRQEGVCPGGGGARGLTDAVAASANQRRKWSQLAERLGNRVSNRKVAGSIPVCAK